jgi:acetylornithine aminotransferase
LIIAMSHLMSIYARIPVAFEKGEGVWLWDTAGKRYLDALAGIAVCDVGHCHPRVTQAICEQAGKLVHTSNLYEIPLQEKLAARLTEIAGMDNAFFCNSGAEANEAAIKIARLHGHQNGIDNPTIVVMENSFHGRTMATLTASGSRKVQAGFEPLVSGFVRVPYNDLAAVAQVASRNRNIVAVLVEPVQGEGGIRVPLPLPDYFHGLRRLCDDNGWLLMLDEIQSGIGRTGKWFAHQWSGVRPDVMTLAKGIASGVPLGACLARGAASQVFKPGNHGSTFGGGPLACAAALATLDVIEEEGLIANAVKMGDAIRDGLTAQLAGVRGVKQVRGLGLMVGIELDVPCGALVQSALEHGLLINVTAGSVIRLLPALIIGRGEVDELVAGLSAVIKTFLAQQPAAQPAG